MSDVLSSNQRAILQELVNTAAEVYRISERATLPWHSLAAALKDARALLAQRNETSVPTETELLKAALLQCYCYYQDGPLHSGWIYRLVPNSEAECKRLGHLMRQQSSEKAEAQPETGADPLAKHCYVMSEPHLSGFRVIVGFSKLEDASEAHQWIVDRTKQSSQTKTSGDGHAG